MGFESGLGVAGSECVPPPYGVYHTRYRDGGHPVRVYGARGGSHGAWYEVERPPREGGVSRYETVSELLEGIRGRTTRWSFARYFREGRWSRSGDPSSDSDLSVLELFAYASGVGPGDERLSIVGDSQGARVVALSDPSITCVRPATAVGIDLSEKSVDVAKLLFHRFGSRIRRARYSEQDVLQEVYKGIIIRNGGRGAFDPTRGTFGSYVSLVCFSVMSNYHRKESRRRHREPTGIKESVDGEWREVDVASSRKLAAKADTHPGSSPIEDLERHLTASIGHPIVRRRVIVMARMLADGETRKRISKVLCIRGQDYRETKTLLEDLSREWAGRALRRPETARTL